MEYDPIEEQCVDPATNITVSWAGGCGIEGNEWQAFKFSHSDWAIKMRFYINETGISRRFEIGDLTKNEVKVERTYQNAIVYLHPNGDHELLYGSYDKKILTREYVTRAIECLYSFGGKDKVKVVL